MMRGRAVRMIPAMGMTACLVVALIVTAWSRPAAAENATPDAAASPAGPTPMGNCVAALGIGKEGDACVALVHASPDAPAVDVSVDGAKVLSALAFGAVSGWMALTAGMHQVRVTATGTEAAKAVIEVRVMLAAGQAYEVAAIGPLASITAQVYPTNLYPISEGAPLARLRVVHAAPDAPPLDLAVKGGDVLIKRLAFPHASADVTLPAGTYHLEVRAAGTTAVVLDLPGVKLDGDTEYSIYAIGRLADGSLKVLPVVAKAPNMMGGPEPPPTPTPNG